jgi:putative two-component system response regulator
VERESQAAQTVLIVDGDEQVRDTLRRILEDRNFDCRLAASAAEAREALDFWTIDLVLSDVMLPGETGLALLRSLRADNPGVPIVMVSGVSDPDVANTAHELGAYGYVTKPFDANQVVIAVNDAILRSRLEEENRGYREQLEWMVTERTLELADALRDLAASDALLRMSSEATIDMLAQAIEGRDIETGQHIARMSRYAALLAHGCGLTEDRCHLIRLASPMHDIGKIGVADGILFKPGALSAAEFDVIKEHAEQGYRILAKSDHPLLQLAATIARTHHERWDGSGYPHGISGVAIPIEGRISAVADVFDAIVSRRVYKPAVPLDEALSIIRDGRETLFDPAVIDAFFENLDEVADIREQYADQ